MRLACVLSGCPQLRLQTATQRYMASVLLPGDSRSVAIDGTLRDASSAAGELLESGSGAVRTLWLNRPKKLHAHSTSLLVALRARLLAHSADDSVRCVALRSTGKRGRAFSAGGDIEALYQLARRGAYRDVDAFFRAEYASNSTIGSMRTHTPTVAVLDGVVMGGGSGISLHGAFRVATENMLFAVPECSIGLHPDAGASHYLQRVRHAPAMGKYLALTGARLRGRDVVNLGIATHFVPSNQVDEMMKELENAQLKTPHDVDTVIRIFESTADTKHDVFPSRAQLHVIEQCFNQNCVESITVSLQEVANEGNDASGFAASCLKQILRGCPTSLKVSLEALIRADGRTLEECLDIEFRLTARLSRHANFMQGVHSAVIDKSVIPCWAPTSLSQVASDHVNRHFEPVSTLGIHELGLSKHGSVRSRG